MNRRMLPPAAELSELEFTAEEIHRHGDVQSLDDARLTVARDYGFDSWAALREEVERRHADPLFPAIRRAARRPFDPPDDELPAVLPIETIWVRAPAATIAVTAANVYSSCCMFELDWVLRHTPETEVYWTRELRETVLFRPFRRIQPDEPESAIEPVRCSVEFADGRTAGNQEDDLVARVRARPDVVFPFLFAHDRAAGTGDGRDCYGQTNVFLWPLPPPGELRFTLSWPAFGIPEGTTTVLDAAAIRAAAERVQRL